MKNQINAAALTSLTAIRAKAVKNQITATEALRTVFEEVPGLTRVEFRHTAEEVGINGLTARNTFDRLTRS